MLIAAIDRKQARPQEASAEEGFFAPAPAHGGKFPRSAVVLM